MKELRNYQVARDGTYSCFNQTDRLLCVKPGFSATTKKSDEYVNLCSNLILPMMAGKEAGHSCTLLRDLESPFQLLRWHKTHHCKHLAVIQSTSNR